MAPSKHIPTYRLHRPTGQAVVTLRCSATGRRRDVYLGQHDTAESRVEYGKALARWEDAGRVLDGAEVTPRVPKRAVRADSVAALVLAYWRERKAAGISEAQLGAIHVTLRVLRSSAGRMRAVDFGPKALLEVREAMVERGWARGTVNARVRIVQQAFRFGVVAELVPVEIHQALKCVEPLRRGQQGVREGKRVLPVPDADVAAVEPHVSPQVWALIRLQLLTGARPGELVGLRAVDLDTAGKVWQATLTSHKSAYRGRPRTVLFGPAAQAVLKPFLAGRPIVQPLFSPKEGNAARKAQGAKAGRRKDQPESPRATSRTIGDAYTVASYRCAIERACAVAGVDRWTPHRLRHNAARRFRREAGIDTAAVVLGHSDARLTAEVYAEADAEKARDVIARVG